MRRQRRHGHGPASESSVADLPAGTPTGAVRATDQAAAEAVGARRPLDIGQGGPVAASARTATLGRAPRAPRRHPVALGVPTVGAPLQPAFDDHHPPDAALVGDCVHCGFCLPTCPTYVLWGEEMDSPRGRIDLMKQGLEGDPLQDSTVRHLDQCLGCMACVTACPSGVQYDKLIEATRAQVERRYERRSDDKAFREMIFKFFPYRSRLRLAAGPLRLYQRFGIGERLRAMGVMDRLPARMRAMEALMPRLAREETIPELTGPAGERRRRVGVLVGCVQQVFFSQVNAATVRVLAAEGCEVVAPKS